jgi:hypothetical protein
MPDIAGTNFEQTHTEQICAQLEIMGHLEIHMSERISALHHPFPPMIKWSAHQQGQFP